MKASEWLERRKKHLLSESGEASDPRDALLAELGAELQAMRELFDCLPPRFGAPHGPAWMPGYGEISRPTLTVSEVKSDGETDRPAILPKNVLQAAQEPPKPEKSMRPILVGPNAEPPLAR